MVSARLVAVTTTSSNAACSDAAKSRARYQITLILNFHDDPYIDFTLYSYLFTLKPESR